MLAEMKIRRERKSGEKIKRNKTRYPPTPNPFFFFFFFFKDPIVDDVATADLFIFIFS